MKESEIPMIGSGQRGEKVQAPELEEAGQVETSAVSPYEAMRKSIRGWGWWMLISAGASVLLGSPEWGAVLVVVALMSFYFRDAAGMFLIFGTGMLWAAISNLFLAGEGGWMIAGAVQILWSLLAFRDYGKYRKLASDPQVGEESGETAVLAASGRSAKMTWLSLLLGAAGLAGICGSISLGIIEYSLAPDGLPAAAYSAMGAILMLGTFAVPAGIAAVSAGYRPKAAAIIGIVLGSLCMVLVIIGLVGTVAGWI